MIEKNEKLDKIVGEISDPMIRLISQEALRIAKKALDMTDRTANQYFIDEIDKIMPKALKLKEDHEIA